MDQIPRSYFYAVTGVAAALALYKLNTVQPSTLAERTYPSPLAKHAHDKSLAYRSSDLLPGGRDLPTPYGNVRLYEFGPRDSRHRVLFLHGISTPCISLYPIASHLATQHGCRVMLLDLFGRGWSGGPRDLPYDARLYATQVFMALAASDVDWTSDQAIGGKGFALVGYSMGGGVAADFASWWPDLVKELVLLAPSGLVRKEHITAQSRLMYSTGWIPEQWLQRLVKRRLRTQPNVTGNAQLPASSLENGRRRGGELEPPAKDATTAPAAELPSDSRIAVSNDKSINIEAAVNWQLDNHDGFLPAFMSSIRHAPIHGQHDRWAICGSEMEKRGKRVLLLMAGNDKLVRPREVGPDAEAVLGSENVRTRVWEEAGHEVPLTHAEEIAEEMWNSWVGLGEMYRTFRHRHD